MSIRFVCACKKTTTIIDCDVVLDQERKKCVHAANVSSNVYQATLSPTDRRVIQHANNGTATECLPAKIIAVHF